jgi:hypothetical protein
MAQDTFTSLIPLTLAIDLNLGIPTSGACEPSIEAKM